MYLSGKLQHVMLGLLRLGLWLLSTWYGTLILCGYKSMSSRFPYFHKFSQLELRRREEIMKSWSSSYIYLLRQLFVGVKFIVMLAHFTQVIYIMLIIPLFLKFFDTYVWINYIPFVFLSLLIISLCMVKLAEYDNPRYVLFHILQV